MSFFHTHKYSTHIDGLANKTNIIEDGRSQKLIRNQVFEMFFYFIQQSDGAIFTQKSLDREHTSKYTMIITAKDGGERPRQVVAVRY